MRKVAVLGPRGTNGHEVARRIINTSDSDVVFCARNESILETCVQDSCVGVVPIENSSKGLVEDVIGFWLRNMENELPITVVGEAHMPIAHALLVSKDCPGIEAIRVVKSHPQALAQCSRFINERNLHALPASSTAQAAQEIVESGESDTAAIASVFAAEVYGLSVAQPHIENHSGNTTRFHILGRETPTVTGKDRTAVIFELPDRTLALASVLSPIGYLGANLSSIHSIPLGNPGEYAFYCEFNLHRDCVEGKKIVACMRELTKRMRVLGSYPQQK